MMIGERNHGTGNNYLSPIHVPPWTLTGDDGNNLNSFNVLSPTAFSDDHSLFLTALQRYLPSNTNDAVSEDDDFRMYEFKVKKCTRGRSHDWTDCPYAHPGEKARRRDPRKYHYSGSACPEFRKGSCLKGDACEHAHGVFECWLHPTRYRTQLCKDGVHCTRRVCFFAHSPEQLRVVSPRGAADSPPAFVGSPESELVASMRQLQLTKVSSMPSSWRLSGGGVLSPRIKLSSSPNGYISSVPSTPTRALTRAGFGLMDSWEEEPVMERVESGRGLREKMFEKLSKENPLDRVEPKQNQTPNPNVNPDANPDVGWGVDLVLGSLVCTVEKGREACGVLKFELSSLPKYGSRRSVRIY